MDPLPPADPVMRKPGVLPISWTAPIRYEEVEALVSSKQQTAREAVLAAIGSGVEDPRSADVTVGNVMGARKPLTLMLDLLPDFRFRKRKSRMTKNPVRMLRRSGHDVGPDNRAPPRGNPRNIG